MKRLAVVAALFSTGATLVYLFVFTSSSSTTFNMESGTQGETTHQVAGVDVPNALAIGGPILALALLAAASWLSVRGHRAASRRGLVATTVVASMAGAYVCIYELNLQGLGILVPVLFFLVPATFGFGMAWGISHTRRLLAVPCALLLSLMPVTMLFHPWPLHIAFFVSAPFLEQLAEEVEAGQSPDLPRWAGVFHIADVDTADGRVALITDPNTSGRSGLVRFAPGPAPDEHHYYGPMYNLNWNHRISDRWRYQNED